MRSVHNPTRHEAHDAHDAHDRKMLIMPGVFYRIVDQSRLRTALTCNPLLNLEIQKP